MVSEFARARGVTVLVGMTSFLLVLIYLYRVRARATAARRTSEPRDLASDDSLAIKHPLAVAFILQLPLGSALLSDAPLAVIALVILVSVVPILRILLHRAPRAARAAYLIAAFYAAGAILDLIPAGSPLRRIAFLGFLIIAIGALAAMMKSRTFRSAHVLGGSARAAKLGIAVVMLTTLAALVASLFGYLSLAQFLRQVILLSSYLALLLIAWSRVVCAVLEMILRSSVFSSPVLKTSVVVLWAGRIIRGCGFIAWVLATVNLLLLANPLARIGQEILTKGLPGRLSDITLGDLLASVTVLAVGWLLARSARFVLREGVLSRVKLEHGIPDLIANLAYYLLLLLAFLTSVKAMGVDLSKLTLLTGAFGVGIGFGMQNVLNNFFSGLILQFERPIHTGDVIEVAGQIGEVVRIGIRSTAIRTPQGAELIVPNASLVSNNVVNWSQRRTGTQISLPVLVAAGAGCENVIHLLVDAAGANAAVLRDPQPTAYLKTSGANGALFELSFSVESSASAERVRCSVSHSVSRALSLAKVVPYEMAH
jgi:small-conductance mechanosensitive channel